MRAYAFAMQKGGVSKTSTSANVAHLLSQDAKVCYIDADPQGNASSWFLTGKDGVSRELADVLRGNCKPEEGIYLYSENLGIVPTFTGSVELTNYKETLLFQEPYVFADLVETLDRQGYQYVIFDTAPGLNQLERSVALACHEVIGVMRPEYFSMDGLETFERFIEKVNKSYRGVEVDARKLVLAMINEGVGTHQLDRVNSNRQRFHRLDYERFEVHQDVNVEKAQEAHLPLALYNPKARALAEYQLIAEALKNGS